MVAKWRDSATLVYALLQSRGAAGRAFQLSPPSVDFQKPRGYVMACTAVRSDSKVGERRS